MCRNNTSVSTFLSKCFYDCRRAGPVVHLTSDLVLLFVFFFCLVCCSSEWEETRLMSSWWSCSPTRSTLCPCSPYMENQPVNHSPRGESPVCTHHHHHYYYYCYYYYYHHNFKWLLQPQLCTILALLLLPLYYFNNLSTATNYCQMLTTHNSKY